MVQVHPLSLVCRIPELHLALWLPLRVGMAVCFFIGVHLIHYLEQRLRFVCRSRMWLPSEFPFQRALCLTHSWVTNSGGNLPLSTFSAQVSSTVSLWRCVHSRPVGSPNSVFLYCLSFKNLIELYCSYVEFRPLPSSQLLSLLACGNLSPVAFSSLTCPAIFLELPSNIFLLVVDSPIYPIHVVGLQLSWNLSASSSNDVGVLPRSPCPLMMLLSPLRR